MRVYVSSTFEDLRAHRDMAIHVLRQLGHQVVAMEDYTATGAPPLRKVLEDVRSCGAFVGIYAWRYGYVPKSDSAFDGAPLNAKAFRSAGRGKTSITEYEYLQAKASDLPILVFLLDEQTPWPPSLIDGFGGRGRDRAIRSLRSRLKQERLVAFFSNPDNLKASVGAAIAIAAVTHKIYLNLIEGAEKIVDPYELDDSSFEPPSSVIDDPSQKRGISKIILDASDEDRKIITIDISATWWSTRLYLLAALAERFSPVRRILLIDRAVEARNVVFVALLGTGDVRLHLARYHPELRPYEERLASYSFSELDIEGCVREGLHAWRPLFAETPEEEIKELVNPQSLRRWLGEAFFVTPLEVIDLEEATILDVVRLLDYPASFVPVLTHTSSKAASRSEQSGQQPSEITKMRIQVVNKTTLNAQLAKAYVNDLMIGQYQQ